MCLSTNIILVALNKPHNSLSTFIIRNISLVPTRFNEGVSHLKKHTHFCHLSELTHREKKWILREMQINIHRYTQVHSTHAHFHTGLIDLTRFDLCADVQMCRFPTSHLFSRCIYVSHIDKHKHPYMCTFKDLRFAQM